MQVIHLPAPGQFFFYGLGHDGLVVLHHIGLNGLALHRRLLDGAHVPDAAHGHIQGAGNRGRRQGKHVHPDERPLELFLVLDPKALFFVDDYQPKIVEFYVVG